jgi:hypothetical protein
MSTHIKIVRYPYEEPDHIHLEWDVSNGTTSSRFDFYLNSESLSKIAEHLEVYPRHRKDVFLFELGSERAEDRFAYYFRFRAFTTDSLGHCALQFRFNNNVDLANRNIVEFCIESEAAQINELGRLFAEFANLSKDTLVWSKDEKKVYDSGNYA